MSGRWRDRISGSRDEFSEKGPELSHEQREHLTRVTDELLQRYSFSRSVGPGDDTGDTAREPVSAAEIGAVLESVLVEAFDFGWFTRSDLPEAPELALEPEGTDWEQGSAAARARDHVYEPVEWPDPRAEEEEAAPEWGKGLGPPRAMEPEPDSELAMDPELDSELAAEPHSEPVVESVPEDVPEPVVESVTEDVPEPVVESVPEDVPEPVVESGREDADLVADAAVEVAELEEIHRVAVQAEREAILFAAATRQRLAEARQTMADLEARAGSPRS